MLSEEEAASVLLFFRIFNPKPESGSDFSNWYSHTFLGSLSHYFLLAYDFKKENKFKSIGKLILE